jgi:hypothetical protein
MYLVLVREDGNSPAWWYVGLLTISAVPLMATAAGWLSRPALVASGVALALAMLLGLLSIGILLLPSVICVIVGAFVMKPASGTPPGPR